MSLYRCLCGETFGSKRNWEAHETECPLAREDVKTTALLGPAHAPKGASAKPTNPENPKDAIGAGKVPLHLVPGAFKAYTAIALAEGAMKYGTANWRAAGVRASIYMSALQRHLDKWWNGEEGDPETGVHHLANACACLAILIDAEWSDKLTDDRPPSQPDLPKLLTAGEVSVAKLKRLFADKNPRHWTIADDEEIAQCSS